VPLIDQTYFVGELNIPDAPKAEVLERLSFLIAKYEEELLRASLGNDLYLAFITGTVGKLEADIDQKWKNLRDGKDYTDLTGRSANWIGLRKGSTKQSMIANYVYYFWLRDRASRTSAVGETRGLSKTEENVSPGTKMARAWNEMVRWISDLVKFLDANRVDYPEWTKVDRSKISRMFKAINVMGI
jgi:hypothetical protein